MDGYPVCAKCWEMHHDKDNHPAKQEGAWAGETRHCSHCGDVTNCGMHMFPGRFCDICKITEPQAGPFHDVGG